MSDLNFNMWEVTNQHLGENGETMAVELQDPEGWFDANVRWDGLMEIHLYHNVPKGEQNPEGDQYVDTLHIGDLDGFIGRLQELRQFCQEFFDFQDAWQRKKREEDGMYEV
jgi:hypothetical protein